VTDSTEQEAERLIQALIYDYAHCIDDDQLEDWPDYFTEDCFYQVISRNDYEQGLPAGVMTCKSRGMLVDRIVSLRNANIYEPQSYRHLISAIRLRGQEDGLWSVQTGYAVIRTMQEGDVSVFSSGKYLDRVDLRGDRPRFKERIAVFDSPRIDTLMVIPI
jgi:anthranilate 1,2-dioxygenase small subunit